MTESDDELRRRKYPRVKEACQVRYRQLEDPAAQPPARGGTAVNISGGGMCFSSPQRVVPGSMLALEMTLAHLPTPVVALARVVWCEPGDDPAAFDVGVEFWWIGWADEDAQKHMLGYINSKLEQLGLNQDGERT